jgi:hypothetical protein
MKIKIEAEDYSEELVFDRGVNVDEMKAYLLDKWYERLIDTFMEVEYDEEVHGRIPYESDTGYHDVSGLRRHIEAMAEEIADEFEGWLCDVGDVVETKFMTATVIAVRDESDTWQTVPGRREWGA